MDFTVSTRALIRICGANKLQALVGDAELQSHALLPV
jgi:hypothetical protein